VSHNGVPSLQLSLHSPDRWLTGQPAGVSGVPGLWANLMTFLGGQRACIGFKFAVLEMKALLFHLVRDFEFELAVDPKDITCREM
jgi:cytochrome P450